jgi:hypothetical protein
LYFWFPTQQIVPLLHPEMASFISPDFQFTSTQTAVALVVPSHRQTELNSLRKIHDKSFGKWDPHINILYPFVEPARLSSALAILRSAIQELKIKSIHVKSDAVGIFPHRRNATVFLKPDDYSNEAICSLRKHLVEALGCRERDGTYDGTFRPHLGIGQASLSGTAVSTLGAQVSKLIGFGWESTKLAVLKRDSCSPRV